MCIRDSISTCVFFELSKLLEELELAVSLVFTEKIVVNELIVRTDDIVVFKLLLEISSTFNWSQFLMVPVVPTCVPVELII